MNETYFPFTIAELKIMKDCLESNIFYWHRHYDGVVGSGHDAIIAHMEMLLEKIECCIKVFETEEEES